MNLQLIESTHAPNRFNTGETYDTHDALARLSVLLAYRAQCRAAIARHSRHSAALARAEWLSEHERTSAKIAALLPQAQSLLASVSREVGAFADEYITIDSRTT